MGEDKHAKQRDDEEVCDQRDPECPDKVEHKTGAGHLRDGEIAAAKHNGVGWSSHWEHEGKRR